ncbi:MlaD family protein [Andreprevotia chitinilytica]|uniref:MlaD family protein n=1 Tax=Andreprevotia chitinilytica TaxID=396808 RepID=UPI00068D1356|nr:MlaD family protein [Andreprevotia chitinilytica]
MTPQKTGYFRLGLFVLIALTLGITLLIAFGSGRWFTTTTMMETYFDESVQGLDVGSKVKYRGVTVGEISKISFTHAKYQQDLPPTARKQYVLVETRLKPELFGSSRLPDASQLVAEVDRGLRVRIAPQGLTGTNYLEIDYQDPKKNPPLAIAWQPDQAYVPSARSTVEQIVTSAQNLVGKLEKLDLVATVDRLNRVLDNGATATAGLKTREISEALLAEIHELKATPIRQTGEETLALVKELRQSSEILHRLVSDPALASAPANIGASAQAARELLTNPALGNTLKELNRASTELSRLVAGRDHQIDTTLNSLQDASEELHQLIKQTRSNPSSLLFSTPPTPYPLPVR